MIKILNISTLFFVSLFTLVSQVVDANNLLPGQVVASWKELALEGTQKASLQIYTEAMVDGTALKGEDPEMAAFLFFKAAELSRDLNDVKHAIPLFKEAIELTPDNLHYRRIYGDYLIGYRGLEEQAWSQYYQARKLVEGHSGEDHPERVNDEFTDSLSRSIHIFRRDTRDGVISFERNRSDGALIYEDDSITITGGLDTVYGKVALDPLDLSLTHFRALNFFDTFGYLGDLPGNDINLVDEKIDRQIEGSETIASFLFRTPNANFPVIRLNYYNASFFEGGINFDALDDYSDRINDRVSLEIEKTIIVKNDLFLEADVSFDYRNQQSRSDNSVFSPVEEYFLYLTGGLNLRKEWGTKDGIIILNAGGTYARDLYDFEHYPIHTQKISLRKLSFQANPFENNTRERFRGRRSSGQEIALIRAERRYEGSSPTVTEDDWRFVVSNQELGLANGKLDLYTTYTYRERNLFEGRDDGSYSVHQFSVEPIWVPVYNLYENDFVDGWEFVTVAFPIKYDTDEGPYDRITGGIKVSGQYVVSPGKLTLGISAGIEYAEYTDLNEGDFGGFIRLTIF
jgi:tetratricopeptide (TPR) repeat protein